MSRLREYFRLPLHEEFSILQRAGSRAKTQLYYQHVFGSMGSHCIIGTPVSLYNAHRIHLGDRVSIGSGGRLDAIIEYAGQRFTPRIEIGKDVYIGPHLHLVAIGRVAIGNGCVLSEQVYISDNSHGLEPDAGLIMEQPLIQGGDVEIGDGCFLGFRSAVLPGVRLGRNCIVGLNSVVTRSFPAYSMLVGSPARLIKSWSVKERAWLPVSDSCVKSI
jgi:acetyltransferase-like isoleucine patch superfamily enzyme